MIINLKKLIFEEILLLVFLANAKFIKTKSKRHGQFKTDVSLMSINL